MLHGAAVSPYSENPYMFTFCVVLATQQLLILAWTEKAVRKSKAVLRSTKQVLLKILPNSLENNGAGISFQYSSSPSCLVFEYKIFETFKKTVFTEHVQVTTLGKYSIKKVFLIFFPEFQRKATPVSSRFTKRLQALGLQLY